MVLCVVTQVYRRGLKKFNLLLRGFSYNYGYTSDYIFIASD